MISTKTSLFAVAAALVLAACGSSSDSAPDTTGAPGADNTYAAAAAAAIAAEARTMLDEADASGADISGSVLDEAQMVAYDIEYPEIVTGLEISEVEGGLRVTTVAEDPDTGAETPGVAYVCFDGDTVTDSAQPCA